MIRQVCKLNIKSIHCVSNIKYIAFIIIQENCEVTDFQFTLDGISTENT